MYTKQEIIISSFRDGKSQRQIARDLQISRKTIRKYLQEHEKALQLAVCIETSQSGNLSSEPVYKMATPRLRLKLTREVETVIDELLEDNERKRGQGLRKQMLKKKDILEELHRRGFDIGYTTVCNHIARRENRVVKKHLFARFIRPGKPVSLTGVRSNSALQGNAGHCNLLFLPPPSAITAMLLFTSGRIPWLSWNLTYAFLKPLVAFTMRWFTIICGVAVAGFVGPHEKEPTRSLLQLRGHYQFRHRFCNIYRGNEKGHVERSVEYVRRKAFAPKDAFTGTLEAQQWLDAAQEGSMRGSSREQAKAPTNCFHKRRTSWASIRPWSLSAVKTECNCGWINMPPSVIAPTVTRFPIIWWESLLM